LEEAQPGLAGYLRIFVRLLQQLKSVRPDAVITFLPLACTFGQTSAWLAGVRCRIASQRNPNWSYGRIMQSCDRLAGTLGIYTSNVANSRFVLDSFMSYPRSYRRRMAVVHNGIEWRPSTLDSEQARQKFKLPPQDPIIVTIGRLTEQKNQALLLDALLRLPTAHLAIAGDGELRQSLTDKARSLGVMDRTHFLGTLVPTDVPDLLRAADIFALPSRYEGQSNALLEAMNAGLPILASDIPPQAETLGGNGEQPAGWLLPLDNPASWAQVIEELIDDHNLRARMGKLARNRVSVYSLEGMGDGFEKVIHQALYPKVDNRQ
jgi:glycosyltransferase involved in cell wall biosynthesis